LRNKKPRVNGAFFNSVAARLGSDDQKKPASWREGEGYAMTRQHTVGETIAAHNGTNCRSPQAAAARALQCRHVVRA
jgi:hypothetical protein